MTIGTCEGPEFVSQLRRMANDFLVDHVQNPELDVQQILRCAVTTHHICNANPVPS